MGHYLQIKNIPVYLRWNYCAFRISAHDLEIESCLSLDFALFVKTAQRMCCTFLCIVQNIHSGKKLKHWRIDLLIEPFSFSLINKQVQKPGSFAFLLHSTSTFKCNPSSMDSLDCFKIFLSECTELRQEFSFSIIKLDKSFVKLSSFERMIILWSCHCMRYLTVIVNSYS